MTDDVLKYDHQLRSEPVENLTDVEIDELTGWRFTYRDVGMTRNAKTENTKEHKVFLDPIPHIILDTNVPLRGWYKPKHEKPGARPRPCYTEALLSQPYGGTCSVKCGFSLPAGVGIKTADGFKNIEDFVVGDLVLGRTQRGIELTEVLGTTSHMSDLGVMEIEMESGYVLRCTPDHPVYSATRGWVNAGDLQVGEEVEKYEESLRTMPTGVYPGWADMLRLRWEDIAVQTPESEADVRALPTCSYLLRQGEILLHSLRGGKLSQAYVGQRKREKTDNNHMLLLRQANQNALSKNLRQRHLLARGPEKGASYGTKPVLRGALVDTRKSSKSLRELCASHLRELRLLFNAYSSGGDHAQFLGSLVCRLSDQLADCLGIRTRNIPVREAAVHPGLSLDTTQRSGGIRGDKRVAGTLNGSKACVGTGAPTVDRSDVSRLARAGDAVKRSRLVPENIRVFDIQTTSQNFYAGELLVHNCYINSGVRGYRGAGITTVDLNYGAKIRKQLAGMRTGAAVYMSSFIDPFIELEEFYGNTRECTNAAIEVGLPIFYLTRLHVPGWAYDALKKNRHSYMQFSINTPDPVDWKRLSPKAMPLEHQFEQIREMKRQGVYVSIQVNPIVAGAVTNEHIVELIHKLAECGADHLIFKFVEITYPVVPGMLTNMYRAFGQERGAKFEALFTQNIGGVRTIEEEYRKAALDIFSVECKRAGVTMSLCYEYEYERDTSGEIISKTGVSMGPRYITSDQCHGHRVPVYSRESEHELFRPIDACPPSGCLTCGDKLQEHELPPCGNPQLAEAGALTEKDLKRVAKRPDNIIAMG